jgi:hypothetical protein
MLPFFANFNIHYISFVNLSMITLVPNECSLKFGPSYFWDPFFFVFGGDVPT